MLLLACGSAETTPPGIHSAPRNVAAKAALWTVDCHGGADFADVRSAIATAASGDQITVAPCSYYGSLDLEGKTLEIRGTDPSTTWIYASPGSSVLKVTHGEGRKTTVQGMTLAGGGGEGEVAAIEVSFSALTLRDVHVRDNVGFVTIYGRSAHLLIEDSVVSNNQPTLGIVVLARRGEIVVQDSSIECGVATAGYQSEHGSALIDGATIDCPAGRSIEIFHAPGRVQRSFLRGALYVENEGSGDEATVVKGSVLASGASVVNSDLVLENVVSTGGLSSTSSTLSLTATVVMGEACAITASGSSISTSYAVFWGHTTLACGFSDPLTRDATSMAVDPQFVSAATEDFHLAADSPLANAGPSSASYTDPAGTRSDIGVYGGHFSMGGGW